MVVGNHASTCSQLSIIILMKIGRSCRSSSDFFIVTMMIQIIKLLLVLQCLIVVSEAKVSRNPGYDFFFFVQQWPGGYCDTKAGCCYPTTGKPEEDFSIHGLWPNFNNGSYPQTCDLSNPFDKSLISDLIERMQKDWPTLSCPSRDGYRFWGHEWNKHGTCSENILDQHSFFEKTLDFKISSNLLQHLKNDGIYPDNGFYNADDVEAAIEKALGVTPYLECNFDKQGNSQLSQVYICVDKLASTFIECPVMPHAKRCTSDIQFESFSDSEIVNDQLITTSIK